MTVGPVTLSNDGDAEAEEEEQSMMCWQREKGGEWVEMKYGSFISKVRGRWRDSDGKG